MQQINIGKSEEQVLTNQQITQKPQDFIEMRNHMKDYAIMLIAPVAVAMLHHGLKAIVLVLISILTCTICRRIGEIVLKCDFSSRDFSNWIIGVTFALLLPSTATWWMVVSGAAFAIIVCVLPFGKTINSPFVPAAAAVSFVTLCWPDRMFAYSDTAGMSLSKMLSQGNSIGSNAVAILEVLTGALPSAMGAGCVLALIGALIFMTIRRPKDTVSAYTFMFAVIIMAILFPRVSTGRFLSVIMEFCGGEVLFGAIFFMTYPSALPKRTFARALWGFGGGIVCMLMRYYGSFEEPMCFGILIACAMTELADKIPLAKWEKSKEEKEEIVVIEPVPAVVPEEVLNEIPDIEEIEIEEEFVEEVVEETPVGESESLHDVIEEENTVTDAQAPFMTGGDSDE